MARSIERIPGIRGRLTVSADSDQRISYRAYPQHLPLPMTPLEARTIVSVLPDGHLFRLHELHKQRRVKRDLVVLRALQVAGLLATP